MNEIAIFYAGHLQMRFTPHALRADEVVTPRAFQPPAAPIGAEVYRDGVLLGTVRCVRRERFDRWAIVYDVPQVRVETSAEDGAVSGTPLDALAPYLNARTVGTLAQLAGEGAPQITVEELSAKTDEALRAIDGIGPSRLLEIRVACDAVLAAATAGEAAPVEEDAARADEDTAEAE